MKKTVRTWLILIAAMMLCLGGCGAGKIPWIVPLGQKAISVYSSTAPFLLPLQESGARIIESELQGDFPPVYAIESFENLEKVIDSISDDSETAVKIRKQLEGYGKSFFQNNSLLLSYGIWGRLEDGFSVDSDLRFENGRLCIIWMIDNKIYIGAQGYRTVLIEAPKDLIEKTETAVVWRRIGKLTSEEFRRERNGAEPES